MDINAADIAALEKILDWAQDAMLNDPQKQDAASEHGELPPEEPSEHGEEAEPELEIEVDAQPEASALKSFRIGGAPPKREEAPLPKKMPVGRKGRY